jgi:single-stranded DNA-binding protein
MSAFVLISGALYRQPEQRTSKADKPFVVATLRCKDGEGSQFWNVIVFSESAQSELLRLNAGDAVSLQGALKAEIYEKNGEAKLSLGIVADHVTALRQPAKPRARPEGKPAPMSRRRRDTGAFDPELNDSVPF